MKLLSLGKYEIEIGRLAIPRPPVLFPRIGGNRVSYRIAWLWWVLAFWNMSRVYCAYRLRSKGDEFELVPDWDDIEEQKFIELLKSKGPK